MKWLFLLHVLHFASKAYKEGINAEKVLSLGCNSQRTHFVLKRLCNETLNFKIIQIEAVLWKTNKQTKPPQFYFLIKQGMTPKICINMVGAKSSINLEPVHVTNACN